MNATKKTFSNVWAMLLVVLSTFIWACTCPPSPNPLISVDDDGLYTVKTDSVLGASTVVIITSSAQGQVLDTANLNVGKSHLIPYKVKTLYPLQLKFFFKSSSGSLVVEDHLQLGFVEINSGGISAMDIVMGLTPPDPAPSTPPSCPNTTQIATGTDEVVFSWEPDDYFEVSITNGGVTQKIGIQTKEAGPTETLGKVHVYRTDIYPCHDNPNCTVSQSKKACMIPIPASPPVSCVLSGNDGAARIVRITGDGSSFLVKKFQ